MDSRLERDGDGGLAVVLPRGRRIEVGAGFDGATLQRLILVLERM
jgi:phage protein D